MVDPNLKPVGHVVQVVLHCWPSWQDFDAFAKILQILCDFQDLNSSCQCGSKINVQLYVHVSITSCQLPADWWLCGWYPRRGSAGCSVRSSARRPPRLRSPSKSRCILFVGKTTHLLPRFPFFVAQWNYCSAVSWNRGGGGGVNEDILIVRSSLPLLPLPKEAKEGRRYGGSTFTVLCR